MAVQIETSNPKGTKRQRSSVSADKKKDNKKAYIPSYVQEGEKCVVCGDNSTGTHYRAMTCEGCKGFFRRTIQKSKGDEPDLTCKKEGACEISPQTRNACQYCRYKRCLAMKMDPSSVLNEKERKNLKQLIDTNRKERKKRVCQALTTDEWNFLKGIGDSYKAIQVSDFYKFMNKKELQEPELPYVTGQMSPSLRHVVDFVRSIPGINKLSSVDICELFFKHLLDIVGLRLAELFDLQENELCFRNFRLRESDLEEYCYMKEIFYFAREYARFVSQDGIILGCLCAIRFLSLDNSKLTNEDKVTETLENIQHIFLKFLGQERVPSVHTIYSRLVNFENIREYRSKILAKMAMLGSGCQEDSELSLSPHPGGRQTPGSSNPQPTATNHLDRPFYQDLIREFNSSPGNRDPSHADYQNQITPPEVDSQELIREANLLEVSREVAPSDMDRLHESVRESNSSVDNMKRAILETAPVGELSYLAYNRPSNSYNVHLVERESLVTNLKQEAATDYDYARDGVGRVSKQVDTSDLMLLQNDRRTDTNETNAARQDFNTNDYKRTLVTLPDAVSYDLVTERPVDRDRSAVADNQNALSLNGEESGMSDLSSLPWLDNNCQGNSNRYGYLNGSQTEAFRSPQPRRYIPSHELSPYKILTVGTSPSRSKLRVVENCQEFSYAADVLHPTPLDLTRDPQLAVQALLLKNAALEATVRRLQYQQNSSKDGSCGSHQPDWMPDNYPGCRGAFVDRHTQGSPFLSPSPDKHSSVHYDHRSLPSPSRLPTPPRLLLHQNNVQGNLGLPTASLYSPAIPYTSRETSHSPAIPSTHKYFSHPVDILNARRIVSHSPSLPSSLSYSQAAEGKRKNSHQSREVESILKYSPSMCSQTGVQGHDPQLLYAPSGSYYHNPCMETTPGNTYYIRPVPVRYEYNSQLQSTTSKTHFPSYSPDSSTTDMFSPRHLGKLLIKSSPPTSPPPAPDIGAIHDFPIHCSASSPCDDQTPSQSTVIKRGHNSCHGNMELSESCDRHATDSYEQNTNDSYEQNTNVSYEQNTNDSYEQNTNDSFEQNTNDSFEQNTNDSFEQNTNDSFEQSDQEIYDSDKQIDVYGRQTEDSIQQPDNRITNATTTNNATKANDAAITTNATKPNNATNGEDSNNHTSAQSLKKRWRDDYLKAL